MPSTPEGDLQRWAAQSPADADDRIFTFSAVWTAHRKSRSKCLPSIERVHLSCIGTSVKQVSDGGVRSFWSTSSMASPVFDVRAGAESQDYDCGTNEDW